MVQSSLHQVETRYDPFFLACEDMIPLDKQHGVLENENMVSKCLTSREERIQGILLS